MSEKRSERNEQEVRSPKDFISTEKDGVPEKCSVGEKDPLHEN